MIINVNMIKKTDTQNQFKRTIYGYDVAQIWFYYKYWRFVCSDVADGSSIDIV